MRIAGPMRRAWPLDADVVLVLACLLVGVLNVWFMPESYEPGDVSKVVDTLLLPLSSLPLIWRHSRPVLAFVALAAGLHVPDLFAPTAIMLWAEFVPFVIAAYSLGSARGSRSAPLVVLVSTLGLLVNTWRSEDFRSADGWLAWIGPLIVFWALGVVIRQLRGRADRLEERAVELEQAQDELVRASAREERLRIARELHDVIAHNVTIMVVLSTGVERVLDDRERAGTALRQIQKAGRDALDEMELLLGVLRVDQQSADDPSVEVHSLDRLVADMRGAGQDVQLVIDGEQPELGHALQTSVYRIVQESLTNALRHARGANVQVRLRFHPKRFTVEVSDDGPGIPAGSPRRGRGLVGMQERAAMHGGHVSAGNAAGRGFAVRADFPLQEAR